MDDQEYSEEPKRGPDAFQMVPREATRAFVLVPWLKSSAKQRGAGKHRSPESRLEEAVGLAAAISLNVVGTAVVPLSAQRPATLFGEGKVEELKDRITELDVELVVVDGSLSTG